MVLRLHTSTCDRAAAVGLLRELLVLMGGENQGGITKEYENEVEVSLGIEDYIPSGKGNKPFWARGIDMLGYSLNSFRLSNLDFVDADSPRGSQVVRLQMNSDDTQKLLDVSGRFVFTLSHLSAHDCLFAMLSYNIYFTQMFESFFLYYLNLTENKFD